MKIYSWILAVGCLSSQIAVAETKLQGKQASPNPKKTTSDVGMRIDCLNDLNLDKGSTQECFSISGLRYKLHQKLNDKLDGYLTFDPFGTPVSDRAQLPMRSSMPTNINISADTGIGFGMVDHYKLNWQPRLNLNVAIEDYPGAAKIPSVSGLSLGSRFQDSGWDQTALTLTYKLGALQGMKVTFAAGNGEGENGINKDPQQYFGFSLKADVYEGVIVSVGASLDGNSIGSDAYTYQWKKYVRDCKIDAVETPELGHSTQRLSVGVELDGRLTGASGLKIGLGFQRNILSDLNKDQQSVPTIEELNKCGPADLDSLFVESEGEVNTVQKTTVGFNLNYPVFDRYFVALDYQQRRIDTGDVKFFQECKGFDNTSCTILGDSVNKLTQDSLTAGAGILLDDGLLWTIEYNTTSFDGDYANAYYVGRNSQATDTWEAINSRFTYHWN